MKKIWALLALIAPLHWASAQSIDPAQSQISFTYKQMNVPMTGRFKQFGGVVNFDASKPEATQVTLDIPIVGIDVGNRDAQGEVAKKAWFDTATFPKAQFVATQVKPLGGNRFEMTGKLTLKGWVQNLTFPFTSTKSGNKTIVEGGVPLRRLAYHIGDGTWSDTDTVADEVAVKFKLTLNP